MPLELKQSHIEAFIRDPALAAWAIFKVELDVFQSARLKTMWFVPNVIDDSGIATGKTEISWIWANLRAILLPNPQPLASRIIGVYYQSLDSARENFGEKYAHYIEQSKEFRNELTRQHGGKLGYQALPGAIQWVYRNGSRVQCPAPGHAQDAKSQASRSFHDGLVDEAKEIDAMSNSLDKQILGRFRAPVYKRNCPIHTNHVVLLGHAEDPDSHPSYKRVKAYKRLIEDGSQDHALITSCFRDWSAEYAAKYRKDSMHREARLTLSKAAFRQIHEGLWEHGTEEWYDSGLIRRCRSRKILPLARRPTMDDGIYTFGWDTAPGPNRKSDLNAGIALRAVPLPPDTTAIRGVFRHAGRCWRITPAWGMQKRGGSAPELSGIIHRAHQRFSFRRIVMDPGGGGEWVLKEMWKNQQFYDGAYHPVTGICKPELASEYPESQAIAVPFTRGSPELMHVWEERFRTSDEGIIEAIHRHTQGYFENGSIVLTASTEDLSLTELAALDPEQRRALAALDAAISQFPQIKAVVDSNGEPKMTKRGFRLFRAEGKRKKDLAYAFLYALTGMLSLLMDPEFVEEDEEAAGGCCAVG